jgi:hypothetical protein
LNTTRCADWVGVSAHGTRVDVKRACSQDECTHRSRCVDTTAFVDVRSRQRAQP